ncbi:hypothetical protein WCT79_19035 [Pectobacterium carotovorum]|uniref:hypothetical protein n=1 Tax=Pectobacterium carotovorum TaxID=554 RepID=UPI0030171E1A
MATLNYEQRQAMIGRRYTSDMNHPDEMAVTVGDVRQASHGFTVAYILKGVSGLRYLGLGEFQRRYPYMVEG